MASDSIDLNLNLGASTTGSEGNSALIHSIDKLTNKLSGFESALNKFIQTSTNYRAANNLNEDIVRSKVYQAKASLLRAGFLNSPLGSSLRQKTVETSSVNATTRAAIQAENSKYRGLAADAYGVGNYKLGDRYTRMIQAGTSKGVEDGFSKLLKSGTVIASARFISGALSRNATLGGQITQAAMTNPLLNYDYGSQISSMMTLAAQQHYSNLGALITGAGTIAGAIGGGILAGPGGVFAGSAVGYGIASSVADFIGASGNAQAAAQAQALGEYLNQANITSSLQGTNAAAFNILQNRSGYVPYSHAGELDPTKPFMTEIAKGAAVYDRNFDAINKLTDYAISAQIPLSQLRQFAGTFAQIRPNNQQFGRMANLANTYGVDITSLGDRTLMFMQGGMNKDTAMNVAAQSFQNVSGFQALQIANFQGADLDRTKKNVLARLAWGVDYDKWLEGDPTQATLVNAKMRNARSSHTDIAKVGFDQSVAAMLGITQSAYNINDPQTRNIIGARTNPSTYQQKTLDMIKRTRMDALNGNLDAGQVTKEMANLAGVTAGVTTQVQSFGAALDQVTNNLMNFATGGIMPSNNPGAPNVGTSSSGRFQSHNGTWTYTTPAGMTPEAARGMFLQYYNTHRSQFGPNGSSMGVH